MKTQAKQAIQKLLNQYFPHGITINVNGMPVFIIDKIAEEIDSIYTTELNRKMEEVLNSLKQTDFDSIMSSVEIHYYDRATEKEEYKKRDRLLKQLRDLKSLLNGTKEDI